MRTYHFAHKKLPVLTRYTAEKILRALSSQAKYIEITLDLGLSSSQVRLENDHAIIQGNVVKNDQLREIADNDDFVYIVENNLLRRVAFFSKGKFYKLKAVGENVSPTLEISGIHMHRIEGITPWEDSIQKVKSIKVSYGERVLDICTGLGYTAILSTKYGAKEVITIEKDENVLKIAEYNPWSRDLENEQKIQIILGDATKVIQELEQNYFDKVIHDPPRFALAGELYSLSFYKEVFRVLRKKGKMFHYTGSPGERFRRKEIVKGVARRLREAGFRVVIRRDLQGVIAIKE